MIDYAHTPDALDKALAGLRPLARQRGGALWCLFGCGGDRDTAKRPMMAAVAEKQADRVVLTSDNPRSEKPAAIISQILLGLSRPEAAQVEPDRAKAILDTLAQAAPEDVVLLAGRGPRGLAGDRGRAHRVLRPGACGRSVDAKERRMSDANTGATMMTLGEAQAWIPGARLVGDAATPVSRVHTDTRTLAAGDLFVALKGERFDANDFLADARARGAAAAIAHGGLAAAGLAGLEVPDTLAALGALAAGWRAQFDAAADRGHRQQRQDHRHADDRVDPARRRRASARSRPPATSTTRSACRSRCCACAPATSSPSSNSA